MLMQEIDDKGSEPRAAEHNRCRDAHAAAYRSFRTGDGARRLHVLQNARTLYEEALAHIGQTDATGRAMQQSNAEPLFECLHVLAGGRLGNAEFARRPGEAPGSRNLGEYCHARQSVHRHHPPGELLPVITSANNSTIRIPNK